MFCSSYPQFQIAQKIIDLSLEPSRKKDSYPVDVLHKEERREFPLTSLVSFQCLVPFNWLPIAVFVEAWSSLSRPDLSHSLSLCCSHVRLLEPNLLVSLWFTHLVFLHVEDRKAEERGGAGVKAPPLYLLISHARTRHDDALPVEFILAWMLLLESWLTIL